jgi:hypothetical protein
VQIIVGSPPVYAEYISMLLSVHAIWDSASAQTIRTTAATTVASDASASASSAWIDRVTLFGHRRDRTGDSRLSVGQDAVELRA